MRLWLVSFLLSSIIFAGEIKVAISANVSYAIEDLKKEFNKIYPDIKVQVILGSTGKLTAQIKHGAPYQLFMGANMDYPQSLYDEGFAVTRPMVYAKGSLAYLSIPKRDFSNVIELLKSDNIKKIAVANPKTAPYGIATKEALKNAKIYDEIKNKFVYGESISQTVTYATRATDIGIIAKSSLFSPQMSHFKKGENWDSLDSKLYTPISQGIVILKTGEKSIEVSAFYAFIFSKKAKKIFEDFGYIVD
jgi:molybdate transport system substrate-binding protein